LSNLHWVANKSEMFQFKKRFSRNVQCLHAGR